MQKLKASKIAWACRRQEKLQEKLLDLFESVDVQAKLEAFKPKNLELLEISQGIQKFECLKAFETA